MACVANLQVIRWSPMQLAVSAIFPAAGVHAASPAFNLSFKWVAIRRVRESGSFIFFFVAPSRAQSIPLAQLRLAGILEEVRDLARAKVKDTKLLTRAS